MATGIRNPLLAPTEVLGKRLLSELSATEETLESLLTTLRTSAEPKSSPSGIPALDTICSSSSTSRPTINNTNSDPTNPPSTSLRKLTLSSRGLTLIYHIISTLITSHNATLIVLDLDRRFSPSHLPSLSSTDLQHIHIFRPTPSNLASTIVSLEGYMLYGEHRSKGREWKGVFILGTMVGLGTASRGLGKEMMVVQAGWKGWMRVEREEVGLFVEGIAVEEAWDERDGRNEVVDGKGWRAWCDGGEFRWD